ncbi:MAG: resolvase, partial [Pseudomonadota bacterium]
VVERILDEKLEPALQFLANPYKLWESGSKTLRQTIARLAFNNHILYDRFEGARTTAIAFPFKALGTLSMCELSCGARGRI